VAPLARHRNSGSGQAAQRTLAKSVKRMTPRPSTSHR
jgi:hypothetical protein